MSGPVFFRRSGGNCPGVKCPGWVNFLEEIVREGTARGGTVLVGIYWSPESLCICDQVSSNLLRMLTEFLYMTINDRVIRLRIDSGISLDSFKLNTLLFLICSKFNHL